MKFVKIKCKEKIINEQQQQKEQQNIHELWDNFKRYNTGVRKPEEEESMKHQKYLK